MLHFENFSIFSYVSNLALALASERFLPGLCTSGSEVWGFCTIRHTSGISGGFRQLRIYDSAVMANFGTFVMRPKEDTARDKLIPRKLVRQSRGDTKEEDVICHHSTHCWQILSIKTPLSSPSNSRIIWHVAAVACVCVKRMRFVYVCVTSDRTISNMATWPLRPRHDVDLLKGGRVDYARQIDFWYHSKWRPGGHLGCKQTWSRNSNTNWISFKLGAERTLGMANMYAHLFSVRFKKWRHGGHICFLTRMITLFWLISRKLCKIGD